MNIRYGEQENEIAQVKKTKMESEKGAHTTTAAISLNLAYVLVVSIQDLNSNKLQKGKKANEHTLAPIDPDQGFKARAMVEVINDNGQVYYKQPPECLVLNYPLKLHFLKIANPLS